MKAFKKKDEPKNLPLTLTGGETKVYPAGNFHANARWVHPGELGGVPSSDHLLKLKVVTDNLEKYSGNDLNFEWQVLLLLSEMNFDEGSAQNIFSNSTIIGVGRPDTKDGHFGPHQVTAKLVEYADSFFVGVPIFGDMVKFYYKLLRGIKRRINQKVKWILDEKLIGRAQSRISVFKSREKIPAKSPFREHPNFREDLDGQTIAISVKVKITKNQIQAILESPQKEVGKKHDHVRRLTFEIFIKNQLLQNAGGWPKINILQMVESTSRVVGQEIVQTPVKTMPINSPKMSLDLLFEKIKNNLPLNRGEKAFLWSFISAGMQAAPNQNLQFIFEKIINNEPLTSEQTRFLEAFWNAGFTANEKKKSRSANSTSTARKKTKKTPEQIAAAKARKAAARARQAQKSSLTSEQKQLLAEQQIKARKRRQLIRILHQIQSQKQAAET